GTRADGVTLASSNFLRNLIRRLRSAELSKNIVLLEAVRREAVRNGPDEIVTLIDSAYDVLRVAQATEPGVVEQLLAQPNFGLWAVECLMRLKNKTSLLEDIGHLAAFAAVAAVRTRQHCRLRLPVRDGIVHLPTLGRVTVPSGSDLSWADFFSDSHDITIAVGSWELRLPGGVPRAGVWTSAYSVAARSHGLEIRLILED